SDRVAAITANKISLQVNTFHCPVLNNQPSGAGFLDSVSPKNWSRINGGIRLLFNVKFQFKQ
ncbi:TPA: hypothetical protein ACF6WO_005176, partial [Klebsiella pneumoniae]